MLQLYCTYIDCHQQPNQEVGTREREGYTNLYLRQSCKKLFSYLLVLKLEMLHVGCCGLSTISNYPVDLSANRNSHAVSSGQGEVMPRGTPGNRTWMAETRGKGQLRLDQNASQKCYVIKMVNNSWTKYTRTPSIRAIA